MKVCKFGGSSVASSGQILKVLQVVRQDPSRRVVVVSAPGKRHSGDVKVTDLLIACAERAQAGGDLEGVVAPVLERFSLIHRELGLPVGLLEDAERELRRRLGGDRSHAGRFLDAVKALGEDFAARFVAAAFTREGLPARYVNPGEAGMTLSEEFGKARLLPESYAKLERSLSGRQDVAVFPGFFGYTRAGEVATFPRGGSDITGAILAAALKAEVYENFTDVDSVYPVDPRLVPEVRSGIREMTYREMRELSYAGFGVFHDEAVLPAIRAGIPIAIRNTNRPAEPGTRIVARRPITPGSILGVASDMGFCTVFVSKFLMNREVGFGRRLLQIFEEERIPFEHTPSGIDSMSVILREENFPEPVRERVLARIRGELDVDEVSFEPALALIMIVGEGMRYTVGLAARITRALAAANVNIEMINQGSSEISLMFGVRASDRHNAVRALYDEFFGAPTPAGGALPPEGAA